MKSSGGDNLDLLSPRAVIERGGGRRNSSAGMSEVADDLAFERSETASYMILSNYIKLKHKNYTVLNV